MNQNQNEDSFIFEDQIQELIDKMRNEADHASRVYESRPDKENTIMPLAFGEAFGFNKGVQQYADELQILLVKSGPKGKEALAKSAKRSSEIGY